ncbi:MAG: methionyl-tRNA formyltransferase [Thermomicrobiales bacterium]|nr:methionyl-tRNA formyltransferase [Thermomicrobiales bacterium]
MLTRDPRVDVALVVTQPDRPAGRGRKLTAPPVKLHADAAQIAVYQPERLRSEGDRAPIVAAQADLFVVAAFGKIFGPKLLAIPRLGSVNLHASLLPAYRGASPISAAILQGEPETGVTLMRMDTGLDTGPILSARSIPIGPDDTTVTLTSTLAELGAALLSDSLNDLATGSLVPTAQDDSRASLTRPMVKADGWIDWRRPAAEIERQVRAMWDWPRAWTTLDGNPVQIHKARVDDATHDVPPGTVVDTRTTAKVATGSGWLILNTVQNAGGKPVDGSSWAMQSGAGDMVLGEKNAPAAPALPFIRPGAG